MGSTRIATRRRSSPASRWVGGARPRVVSPAHLWKASTPKSVRASGCTWSREPRHAQVQVVPMQIKWTCPRLEEREDEHVLGRILDSIMDMGRDIGSLMELFALLEGRSEDVRADRPTHHRRCVRRHRDRVGDFLHFHRSRVPGGRGGLLWRAVQSNCRIELHIHGGRFRRRYLGGRGADSRRDLPLSRRRNRQTRRSLERHTLKGGGLLRL